MDIKDVGNMKRKKDGTPIKRTVPMPKETQEKLSGAKKKFEKLGKKKK